MHVNIPISKHNDPHKAESKHNNQKHNQKQKNIHLSTSNHIKYQY